MVRIGGYLREIPHPERARRSCRPRLPSRSPEGGDPKFPIGHHPGQVCDRRQMSSLAGAAADVGNCLLPRGRRNSDTHGNVSRRRAETVSDHRANTSTRATKPIPMRATEAAPPNQRAVAVRRSTSAGSSSSSSPSSPRSAPHARRNRAAAARSAPVRTAARSGARRRFAGSRGAGRWRRAAPASPKSAG